MYMYQVGTNLVPRIDSVERERGVLLSKQQRARNNGQVVQTRLS